MSRKIIAPVLEFQSAPFKQVIQDFKCNPSFKNSSKHPAITDSVNNNELYTILFSHESCIYETFDTIKAYFKR